MESKLLRPGGKTIVEVTAEQEEQLAQQRRDLEIQREKEQRLQERLRKKRADKERHTEEYTSKQEEADHKSKKLKKLFKAFKEAKREIEALQEDFTHEREVLSQSFTDLQQDLKLRQLIIEHFVPPEEVAKIENRAVFDEASEEWTLKSAGNQGDGAGEDEINTLIARPITAMPGGRHAVSEDAKMRAMVEDPTNPRYRAENVYLVELDMPDRTTQDYVGPMVDPHVAAALEDALRDEEDMTLDADPEDFLDKAFRKAQKDQRRAKKAAKNGGQPPPSRSRPTAGTRPAPPPQDRSTVVPESRTGGRKGRLS
jgi:kinesin family protein 3/17